MRNFRKYLALTLSFLIILFLAANQKQQAVDEQFVKLMSQDANALIQSFDDLDRAINQLSNKPSSTDSLITSFNNARYNYKRLEFLLEYYYPDLAKVLNGALVTKVDLYDKDKVFEPEGFQVLEEIVFSSNAHNKKVEIQQEFSRIKYYPKRIKNDLRALSTTESHIFEMMRLEIIRIIAIGITGGDATISYNSINETVYCLSSMQQTVELINKAYPTKATKEFKLTAAVLAKSINYLKANTDFNQFNRAVFIKDYLNPLSASLLQYQQALDIKLFSFLTAFDFSRKHVFDTNAINPNFFAVLNIDDTINSKQKIDLGKQLFFDPILSKNNERSCASCHLPNKAFTDGKQKSLAMDFKGTVGRNAPTIINAVFQKSLFYDGRVSFLEHQVKDVISNPIELHGSFDNVIPILKQSAEYKKLFQEAFKGARDTSISTNTIATALAQYEKSIIGFNSRFDKYMRNEKVVFTKAEINGFNIFTGKGKCGTCHFPPLFSGVVPPSFQDQEFEVIGVPNDVSGKILDADQGRYLATNIDLHKHSFKTPTVRNIQLTAPYMHNGVYNTLEQVMDFYNKGAGKNLTIPLENMTLPFDSLNLSKKEISDVIAFMNALTDTTGLTNMPKSLPLFNNPVIDKRKIGGSY